MLGHSILAWKKHLFLMNHLGSYRMLHSASCHRPSSNLDSYLVTVYCWIIKALPHKLSRVTLICFFVMVWFEDHMEFPAWSRRTRLPLSPILRVPVEFANVVFLFATRTTVWSDTCPLAVCPSNFCMALHSMLNCLDNPNDIIAIFTNIKLLKLIISKS